MSNKRNLLEGPIASQLIYFALPIAASSMLQQLFNAADTAVVGRFAGSLALAAVGANSMVCTLFINALNGLSVGANVVIAQYIGGKEENLIQNAVHTIILFGILFGILICCLGQLGAGPLLTLIGTPDDTIIQAIIYLRYYLLGIPFISLFNFGSAIVRSNGDTKSPMFSLLVAGVINLILNLIFVIMFKMSVAGVALATTISNMVASGIIIYILTKQQNFLHLDLRNLRIYKDPLIAVLKTGAPASIQGMVFSIANISIQSGINSFGSNAIAGNATERNFEILSYYICTAFNQAAVTFCGQNFAAGNYNRVKKIYRLCLLEAVIFMIAMDSISYLGRNTLFQLFTTDPDVIHYALMKMQVAIVPHFLLTSYEITASILRGIGYSIEPTIITILGSVGFRLLWLVTVFRKWHSFIVLMAVYPVSWIFTGTMMIVLYFYLSKKKLVK